ncbi:MAG: hypothetical protein VKI83_06625 [Synechococcaceae cyanobacterium]|nr:hypothetical protein [Synechococcaceae cyanobacterium]
MLDVQHAVRIVRTLEKAGVPIDGLQGKNPFLPEMNTPRSEIIRETLLANDPELAMELRQAAGTAPTPSMALLAAQGSSLPLPEHLQAEADLIDPAGAAARRQAAEAALLARWEQGAEVLASSRATAADDPAFQAQLEVSRRAAARDAFNSWMAAQ